MGDRWVSPAGDLGDVVVSDRGARVSWLGRDDGWSYDAGLFEVDGDVVVRVRAWVGDGCERGSVPVVWHLASSTNLLRLVADGVEAEPFSVPAVGDEGAVTVRTVLHGVVVFGVVAAGWSLWVADLVARVTGAFGGGAR